MVKLAVRLMQKDENINKNIFFSPSSISICIGMIYAGAVGETKSQISKVLFDNLPEEIVFKELKNLTTLLNAPSDIYNLRIANRLYIQKHFVVLQKYVEKLKNYFSSDIISADFISNPDLILTEINQWVKNQTSNKIKELLTKESLNANVRIILVNAMYFKADWALKFQKSDTSEKLFFVSQELTKPVEMMSQLKRKFYYTENDDAQMLGIPYENYKLTFFIFLPKRRFGLNELESKLTDVDCLDMIQNASHTEIDEVYFALYIEHLQLKHCHVCLKVQVPKFKMEHLLDLKTVLQSLGVTDMFSSRADFSDINGRKDLYISGAIHKSFIEVIYRGIFLSPSHLNTRENDVQVCIIT